MTTQNNTLSLGTLNTRIDALKADNQNLREYVSKFAPSVQVEIIDLKQTIAALTNRIDELERHGSTLPPMDTRDVYSLPPISFDVDTDTHTIDASHVSPKLKDTLKAKMSVPKVKSLSGTPKTALPFAEQLPLTAQFIVNRIQLVLNGELEEKDALNDKINSQSAKTNTPDFRVWLPTPEHKKFKASWNADSSIPKLDDAVIALAGAVERIAPELYMELS